MFLKEWMADNHGIMRCIIRINPDHLCIHFSLIRSSCLSKSKLPSIMMAKSKRLLKAGHDFTNSNYLFASTHCKTG